MTAKSPFVQQGIAAAKSGQRELARQFLHAAVENDEQDVAAWWWLARVVEDPKVSHKCLEKARAAASESAEGTCVYQELLRESGAPHLPRLKLAGESKSTGDQCPICTNTMSVGEEVVVCPACHRANHRECWEDNLFHCGNYACEGSGFVAHRGPPQVEAKAQEKTVRLEQSDIPEETPWESRENQEAGFFNRLRQRQFEAMAARLMHRMAEDSARERARQEYVQQMRREFARRTGRAFVAGLLAGACIAVPVFQSTQSWFIAAWTVVLLAWSASSVAGHVFLDSDRLTASLYGLLPMLAATLITWQVFAMCGNGLIACAAALLVVLVLRRVLQVGFLYERRGFIAYSSWAVVALAIVRLLVHQR